jgi:hypothetical protein
MNIDLAIKLKQRFLSAVSELDGMVTDARSMGDDNDLNEIRQRVAYSIGFISTNLLDPVLSAYPEIDDLK